MVTQVNNSTENAVQASPEMGRKAVMDDLMEVELLLRHLMSEEYQASGETEFLTPILAEAALRKLMKACGKVTGGRDIQDLH